MADTQEPKQEYRLDEEVHQVAAPQPASGAQITICPRCNHDLSAFDSHEEVGTPTGPRRMHRLAVCLDFVKSDLQFAAPAFDSQKEQKRVREAKEKERQAEERKPRTSPPDLSDEERKEFERKEKARLEGLAKEETKATPASEPRKIQSEAEETKKK